jgi:hypothetical protein
VLGEKAGDFNISIKEVKFLLWSIIYVILNLILAAGSLNVISDFVLRGKDDN